METENTNNICKTTLLDIIRTASMRYKQPMILCVSNMLSGMGGEADWSVSLGMVLSLCIMLGVIAPITHITVPTIFTLLYTHLSFTFSNLHGKKTVPIIR